MELAIVIWAVGTLPTLAAFVCFAAFLIATMSTLLWGSTLVFSKLEDVAEKDKEGLEAVSKVAGKVVLWTIPIWFVAMLVPDKTTSYQMLAAYGVQKTVENPKAQELASDGVDVLSALMEKAKKELAVDKK